jgi:hypothetical protein
VTLDHERPGSSPRRSRRATAPSWLEWIQKWERSIGEPVEQFVRSDAYFDLMTQVKRARAQVTRKVEGACEEWLHLFNCRPRPTSPRCASSSAGSSGR